MSSKIVHFLLISLLVAAVAVQAHPGAIRRTATGGKQPKPFNGANPLPELPKPSPKAKVEGLQADLLKPKAHPKPTTSPEAKPTVRSLKGMFMDQTESLTRGIITLPSRTTVSGEDQQLTESQAQWLASHQS